MSAAAQAVGLDGDRADDVAAIEAIVADVEAGFNANDAELMNRHVAADATIVNALGGEARGRDEIMAASVAGLAGPLADERARYLVTDVTFVRPDVALAHKRAWAVDADGRELDVGHAMVALYVLVREDGRWWIAARQNTLVPGG
ncbi:SgcJ/EcaC family oxidoreductase [Iamia sp. SCSIO 61187]|uniref:SgcJ/EcaC family oxidoreductase n=1 Tax=Iamia sp. SCSIO 61187 TaxID=2722752 RepID=UPI001C62D2BC|nr:SgcJ/EcaC family oxidoreductase [Iamia sp. SCSIO 61187]QYG92111.1 SgcJ/EcaC family oxidoreductase [Iamia sp. SCSIO 61187]